MIKNEEISPKGSNTINDNEMIVETVSIRPVKVIL